MFILYVQAFKARSNLKLILGQFLYKLTPIGFAFHTFVQILKILNRFHSYKRRNFNFN